MGDRVVTAPEAFPEEQYRWLELPEKYWIGAGEPGVLYAQGLYRPA